MMTYSDYIYCLRDFLEELGVVVIFPYHDKAKEPLLADICSSVVSGRISYCAAAIWVSSQAAIDALITLAHEGGHWWSYLLWPDEDFNREQRELLAFNFGWYMLDSVGALSVISLEEWVAAHDEIFD